MEKKPAMNANTKPSFFHLITQGVLLLIIPLTGCHYGSTGSSYPASGNNSFPFFNQTRVAPPATGSYVKPIGLRSPNSPQTPSESAPNSSLLPTPDRPVDGVDANSSTDDLWPESFGPRSQSNHPVSSSDLKTAHGRDQGLNSNSGEFMMARERSFQRGLPATDLMQVSNITPSAGLPKTHMTQTQQGQVAPIATQWSGSPTASAEHHEQMNSKAQAVMPASNHLEAQTEKPNLEPALSDSGNLQWRNPNLR